MENTLGLNERRILTFYEIKKNCYNRSFRREVAALVLATHIRERTNRFCVPTTTTNLFLRLAI